MSLSITKLIKKAILISSFLFLCLAGAMAQNIGDANMNGTVDVVDALVIAQKFVGLNPSPYSAQAADANCSGSVDIVDALLVAQYFVGSRGALWNIKNTV